MIHGILETDKEAQGQQENICVPCAGSCNRLQHTVSSHSQTAV